MMKVSDRDRNVKVKMFGCVAVIVFSERELTFTFAIILSPVHLSSATLVSLTQPVEIFGNASTPFGTSQIPLR